MDCCGPSLRNESHLRDVARVYLVAIDLEMNRRSRSIVTYPTVVAVPAGVRCCLEHVVPPIVW